MGNSQGILVSNAFVPLIENNQIIEKESIIERLEERIERLEKLTSNDPEFWDAYKDPNKLNAWRKYYEENYLKINAYGEALKYMKKH
jgi:hypothetical protein